MYKNKAEMEDRNKTTLKSVVHFCRCRVVFMHSFVSALFLYLFRPMNFTETFSVVQKAAILILTNDYMEYTAGMSHYIILCNATANWNSGANYNCSQLIKWYLRWTTLV